MYLTKLFSFIFITLAVSTYGQEEEKFTAAPNPFSDSTVFTIFDLMDDTVTLVLYNRWGNVVATVLDKEVLSGTALVPFYGDSLEYAVYITLLKVNEKYYSGFDLTKSPSTAISLPGEKPSIHIYPNPVRDMLYVEAEAGISGLELYDSVGRLVLQESGERHFAIDTAGLQSGVYYLHLVVHGTTFVKKIIKDRS